MTKTNSTIYFSLTQGFEAGYAGEGGIYSFNPQTKQVKTEFYYSAQGAWWANNPGFSSLGGSWGALVGGSTQSAPTLAASSSRNEIVLVVKGSDDAIYRNSWNSHGWAGWLRLPSGLTRESPGATIIGENLHIAVLGIEGPSVWKASVNLSSGDFSGWTQLSTSTPSKPALTS